MYMCWSWVWPIHPSIRPMHLQDYTSPPSITIQPFLTSLLCLSLVQNPNTIHESHSNILSSNPPESPTLHIPL